MATISIADYPKLQSMLLDALERGQCKTIDELTADGKYILRVRLPTWEVSMLWHGVSFGDTAGGLRQFRLLPSQIAEMRVDEAAIKNLHTHDKLAKLTTGRRMTAEAVLGNPTHCPSLAKIAAENMIARGTPRYAILVHLFTQIHKNLSAKFALATLSNLELDLDLDSSAFDK